MDDLLDAAYFKFFVNIDLDILLQVYKQAVFGSGHNYSILLLVHLEELRLSL